MIEIRFNDFHEYNYTEEGFELHPGKDTTPKSKKEIEREKLLDDIYKKVFEKKE